MFRNIENTEELINKIEDEILNDGAELIEWVKNLDKETNQIKSKIEELNESKAKTEKNIKEFKKYIKHSMLKLDIKKIQSEKGMIMLKKAPKKLILDENDIEEKYIKQIIVNKIDKDLIKSDLNANVKVVGASFVEGEMQLVIK